MASEAEKARGFDGRIVLVAAFLILTVLLETVLKSPLRLTGHRAFPGALTLLLFADTFGPLYAVPFAIVVPLFLTLAGVSKPMMIASWALAALFILAVGGWRDRKPLLYCLAAGLVFGLGRCLMTGGGFHHMIEPVRMIGHSIFGMLGGFAAWGMMKTPGRRDGS